MPGGKNKDEGLEDLFPPPLFRAIAGEEESAGIDPQVDHSLGQYNGATVAFYHRHIPAHFIQAFLDEWLEPKGRRTSEGYDFGSIFLDGRHRFLCRSFHRIRGFTPQGLIPILQYA